MRSDKPFRINILMSNDMSFNNTDVFDSENALVISAVISETRVVCSILSSMLPSLVLEADDYS